MEERGNPADCVAAVKLKPHKQTEKSDNYLLLLFSINCEIERKKKSQNAKPNSISLETLYVVCALAIFG